MSKSTLKVTALPKEKSTRELAKLIDQQLSDMKAVNIIYINVKDISSVTDVMVIASGNSSRHVKSIADNLVEQCKQRHLPVLGMEGQDTAEWVLIDLGDIVVHVMQDSTRKFYELEKLWDDGENSKKTPKEEKPKKDNKKESSSKSRKEKPRK